MSRMRVVSVGVAGVEMPTLDIPPRCGELCTWIVVRPGQGKQERSRLKYRNAACLHHRQAPVAAAEAALRDPWSAA